VIKFNKIPGIKSETSLLDYQGELVFLMRYLLEKGFATKVGTYNSDDAPIPLFKHHERGRYDVESITKKTGEKLLEGIKLKQLAKLNILASWIIRKFPLIKKTAEAHFDQRLDSEKHQTQIITSAAHYLYQQENNNIFPFQEKIIYGLSSFAFVLLAVYLYARNTNTVFQVLSICLFIAGSLSLVSLFILKSSKNLRPKFLQLGATTAIFSFFLGIYQRILLSLEWDGRFVATFVIFPIIILFVFKALYLFAFTLSRYSKEDSVISMLYECLDRTKSNVFRLNEVSILFTVASIGMLVMANFSIFWESLRYIMK